MAPPPFQGMAKTVSKEFRDTQYQTVTALRLWSSSCPEVSKSSLEALRVLFLAMSCDHRIDDGEANGVCNLAPKP